MGEMFDKLWRRETVSHRACLCRFVLMFSQCNFMFQYKGTEVEIKSTARAIYLIFNSSTQTALLHVSLNDLEEGFVFTATMLRRLLRIEYRLISQRFNKKIATSPDYITYLKRVLQVVLFVRYISGKRIKRRKKLSLQQQMMMFYIKIGIFVAINNA